MMTFLIRHGSTEFTQKGLSQGQLDIPLSEKGVYEAERMQEAVRRLPINVIYSSPLMRCSQTARIINQGLDLPLIVDDRIMEMFLGRRQGTDFYKWSEEERELFRRRPEVYGAESNESFYSRVTDFYKDVLTRGQNALIVSHGGVFKNIYRYIHGINDFTTKFRTPETCEIFKLQEL